MSESIFHIDVGPYGKRMILHTPWNDDVRNAFQHKQIVDADFRSPLCFPEGDADFLLEFPDLQGLSVYTHLKDSSPVLQLSELRRLQLNTARPLEMLLSGFKKLEELSVVWHNGLKGLGELASLRKLVIDHPPTAIIPTIADLDNLEQLSLFSCSAEDLSPLGKLKNLKYLRLSMFRKNKENIFVANLKQLEVYFIQDCSGFTSFEPLRDLVKLKKIAISEAGPYSSLEPLSNLANLEHCGIGGIVLDGDYSPIEDMPQLQGYSRT